MSVLGYQVEFSHFCCPWTLNNSTIINMFVIKSAFNL